MFYCREKELKQMQKRYDDNKFECVVIYGRRRVGKTALINEFCKNKPTIFFSALNATEKENLNALSKAIYELKNIAGGNAPIYNSFDDAFAEITNISESERIIFVIDEYPYLAKSSASISSRLQHLIDRVWQESKLYLILCGSSMSFMENQVLGYESPLYGRRTSQFKVEPLSYREITTFNKNLSYTDQALIYGITNGIPHYINKLNVKEDLDEAILENVFDPSSYLFEEPENLLKQELREPALYNSIITAVAAGASRLNDIAMKVGIDSNVCNKYIKTLLELGILIKETPITEKSGKKTIYLLRDNFFRFWYHFVPKNMSSIQSGRIEQNYDSSIKKYYSDYMGLIFEKMCREYLIKYASDLPIMLADVGQWWGSDAKKKQQIQIDIVGCSAENDKEFIIGSCKYKNEIIGVDELEKLKEYAQVFNERGKYNFYIFSKSGFTEKLKDLEMQGEVHLVTLADLYML